MQEFKALLNQYKNRINLGIVLRAVLGNVLLFVGGLHLYFILWLVLGAYSPALIYANIGIRIGLALSIIYVVWQAYRDMWSHFKMARYLDLKHNAQDDLYQNAWELNIKASENPISKALLESANKRIIATEYSLPKLFNASMLLIISIFLVAVCAFWYWFRADFTTAFTQFYSNKAPQIIYKDHISLSPGSIQIGKNQQVLIKINEPDIRLKHRLFFRVGENWRELGMMQNSYLFPRLEQSIEYYAENEIAKSAVYKITVLDEPIVRKWQVSYSYPSYTSIPSYTDSMSYGNIEAYKGSVVRLRITSNIPIKKAYMKFDNASVKELTALSETEYTTQIKIESAHSWYLELEDELGRKSRPEEKYIRVLPDDPPQIRIVFPGEDTTLNQNLMLPLIISADDDFGLANCSLNYQVNTDELRTINIQNVIPNKLFNTDYLWDMQANDLFPGDVVTYWAEIYDNAPTPQKGVSSRFRARFPSIEEIYAEIEQQEQNRKSDLSKSWEESEKLQERFEQKRRELLKDPELAWEDKKQLEDILAAQEELVEQVDNIAESYQDLIDKMQANSALSQETLQKMMRIQELMQDIATEDMLEAMRKLEQAMENVDPAALKKAMEDFKFSMEDFAKNIEQTLALLESIKNEQAVQKALQISEEMEKMQKALHDKTIDPSQDAEKLAQDQQQISDKYDALSQELEKLQEMLKQDPTASKQLEELMKDMKQSQANKDMQQSSESLQQNLRQQSMQAQTSAMEKMRRFTMKLAEMKNSMSSGAQSAMAQAIEQAVRELLIFSKKHEQTIIRYQNDPYPLVPELISSYEGLQIILNKLFSMPQVSMAIPPKFYMDLSETNKGFRDIFGSLGQSFTPSISRELRSIQAGINLMAHDLILAMQNASSGGGGGGMQSLMQMLEQMGQEQMAMNMLTQQLMMQIQAQGGSMDSAMQEQIGKLASEHERLAENLRRALQQDPQAQKQGNAIRQIIEEAEAVARNLRNLRMDDDLIKRQENILSRLLDAQRSINKRDTSERREARRSTGDPSDRKPQAVDYDRLRRAMMLDDSFKKYPREYQQLIMEYLKLLEESSQ
ncbi:MAG: hypothetical protein M0Q19_03385 [Candidatus Cloacimonetes bacterium]|nr:hypothetical protein [Candidatus Cloacimonadota bacterium]MCK9332202.1 hypothetical protein [Candidatus Cloacimonadota bacterium]MDD4232373.1 hypothetical protein [Candidatus Cloacimonadota bacterium]MDY0298712.1 hypothetical protein [Candidatus Cloacimonadaceae bacterium]